MMFIRNLLFYLGLIPATLIITILGWLFFFMPYGVRYWIITRWSHFFIFWAKITCGLRYQVTGRKHIPKEASIVFSNHQSMWETIFMQVLLPKQTWILKKELLSIPIFGWGLRLIEPIAIDRSQSRSIRELVQQGREKLKLGRWIVIFPEGTRVNPGVYKAFTRSGASLAKGTGASVLPISHNAGIFWPKGLFIKKPGIIKVQIGPVIKTEDKTINEINQAAEVWIRNALENS